VRGGEAVPQQVLAVSRSASLNLVEAYERGASNYAAYGERVADSTPVGWVSDLVRAQATFTREVARISAANARQLLDR
jgi:hypothetical protein